MKRLFAALAFTLLVAVIFAANTQVPAPSGGMIAVANPPYYKVAGDCQTTTTVMTFNVSSSYNVNEILVGVNAAVYLTIDNTTPSSTNGIYVAAGQSPLWLHNVKVVTAVKVLPVTGTVRADVTQFAIRPSSDY